MSGEGEPTGPLDGRNDSARPIAELTPGLVHWFLTDDLVCGQELADAVRDAGATEGCVWVVDETQEVLVPVWNNGARGSDFVMSFTQPLDRGIISMVFATEQPFIENEARSNRRLDSRLDNRLGVRTEALIAVPLLVEGRCIGVVSCVRLAGEISDVQIEADGASGLRFETPALSVMYRAAQYLGQRLSSEIQGRSGA